MGEVWEDNVDFWVWAVWFVETFDCGFVEDFDGNFLGYICLTFSGSSFAYCIIWVLGRLVWVFCFVCCGESHVSFCPFGGEDC